MLVGFFVLFELSKWQTYLIVLLNLAVLFGAHYLLANYINRPRSYGSRPSPGYADLRFREPVLPVVKLDALVLDVALPADPFCACQSTCAGRSRARPV
jgi:hypothetical protein